MFNLNVIANADDDSPATKKQTPNVHVDGAAEAGYSPQSGGTIGVKASIGTEPEKKTLPVANGSDKLELKLQPRAAANVQISTHDGSIQKSGVAVQAFEIDHRSNKRFQIKMLNPTIQYQADQRLGLTELPRLDYFRWGLG